jgi:dihydrolipoamide dehydrogenase
VIQAIAERNIMAEQIVTNVVVLGGGPAGYAAAFRAADLGLKVTIIEEGPFLGGTCLHRGCIPSKTLLHLAKLVTDAREASAMGIDFGIPNFDFTKLNAWKDGVISRLARGLSGLAKKRNITQVQGRGVFRDVHTVVVSRNSLETASIQFENAIIATGSQPAQIPVFPRSPLIMDSTVALSLKTIPKTLLVVGAGYIGLELGQVYAALGSSVSVVELMDEILPGVDADLIKPLERRLRRQFKDLFLKSKVETIIPSDQGLSVQMALSDGSQKKIEFEQVLVAVGRKPVSGNLGLEQIGVAIDKRGFISTTLDKRTNVPHIFAIGDVAGEPMLAHKGTHEGLVAAEVIAGHKRTFEPKSIPAVVFTDPEIAWCGLTEAEAKKDPARNIKVSAFPWTASGRAISLGRTDGLTKLIVDVETDRVLGLGLVGSGAGDMISEGVLAIEMGTRADDLSLTIHPHPTLSETIMEAAEGFYGKSIHG